MQDNLISLFIIILTVWLVSWLGKQEKGWIKSVLNWFPAILFAYVVPAMITHLFGLDLKSVIWHSISKNWIIPFAILAVMGALPFKQLKIVGARPILLFVFGSLVIAVLPVLLVLVFSNINDSYQNLFLGQDYWKGLVPIVGGWIGGSTSQLVLKEVIGTEEGLFLSILVLDNILVNIWTILMFQFIKRSKTINRKLRINDEIAVATDNSQIGSHRTLKHHWIIIIILSITVISNLLGADFLWMIISLSILGLLIGNLVKEWDIQFVLKLGGLAIIIIMAILGLRLDFNSLSLPLPLVILVVIWLVLHYILMMFAAFIMKINVAWVPIASMANLGGISTAPAVTSAYDKSLMPHAVLLAILSMVTGTMWGLLTIRLFVLIGG